MQLSQQRTLEKMVQGIPESASQYLLSDSLSLLESELTSVMRLRDVRKWHA